MSSKADPQRKALGRGLSSLLPNKPAKTSAGRSDAVATGAQKGCFSLPIELIDPNPHQPRTVFEPDKLQELAASIKANGVIQPLIVRQRGARYELVAGERRLRAAALAELAEVPVVIQDYTDDRILELQLIENIQREDLNPIEVAAAFERLVKEHGLTHEEIGHRTGKDRTTITNTIRLLRLPDLVKVLLAERSLTMGQARPLLALESEETQVKLAVECVKRGLSARQVERSVQQILENRTVGQSESTPRDPVKVDPNVRSAMENLERFLGTRVRLVQSSDHRGRIEIHYFCEEDLARIYSLIVGEEEDK